MKTTNIDITEILQKQNITAVIRGDVRASDFDETLLNKKVNGQPIIEILSGGDIDFIKYEADLLKIYQKMARDAIIDRAEQYRAQFLGTHSATKIASYMRKANYANGALNGDEGAIAYLTPEAEARNISVNELACTILGRTQLSDKIDAAINGFEVRAKEALTNLTSLSQIEATLSDLQQTAENYFNQLLKG